MSQTYLQIIHIPNLSFSLPQPQQKTMTCQLWLQKRATSTSSLILLSIINLCLYKLAYKYRQGTSNCLTHNNQYHPFCACWHICMSTTGTAPRHIDLLPILPGSSPNVSLPPAPDETSASSDDIKYVSTDWKKWKQQNTKKHTRNLTSGLYGAYIDWNTLAILLKK